MKISWWTELPQWLLLAAMIVVAIVSWGGGRWLMASGILLTLAGAARSPGLLWAALVLSFAGGVAVVVCSYVAWRSAPDREPAGRRAS